MINIPRSPAAYIFLFILFFLFANPTYNFAQSKAPKDSVKNNALVPGTWAMQFQINKLFQSKNYNGFTFYGKYQNNRHNAVRAGFGLNFMNLKSADFVNLAYIGILLEDPRNVDTNTKYDYNSQQYSLTFQFIEYPYINSNVLFYLGAGPDLGYSRNVLKANFSYTYPPYYDSNSLELWSVGIAGVLGAEWFFTRNMSISAEYDIIAEIEWGTLDDITGNVFYNSQTKTNTQQEIRTGHNPSNFRISANNVEFGLSFYFL